MASNYPGSADSFDTIAADKKQSDTVGGRTHRAMHNDLGDAIEAVQAELGTNPSGGDATVAARLTAIEAGTNLGTGSVTSTHILNGTIVDADVNASAAIARTKVAGYSEGTAVPNGSVTGNPGDVYFQTSTAATVSGALTWRKATGTGNTGWVAGAEADTGWRRIVGWDSGSYTYGESVGPGSDWNIAGNSGALLLRRVGDQVTLAVSGAIGLVANPTGTYPASRLCDLPAGFGAGYSQTTLIQVSGSTAVVSLKWGGYTIDRAGNVAYPDGGRWLAGGAALHAVVDTTWPTSLPGTAA